MNTSCVFDKRLCFYELVAESEGIRIGKLDFRRIFALKEAFDSEFRHLCKVAALLLGIGRLRQRPRKYSKGEKNYYTNRNA